MITFDRYRSPYSWRYGTSRMREIWGERNKRKIWRRIWVALAEVQMEFDLVGEDQVEALKRHQEDVDVQRSLQVEGKIHHDLMAELRVYGEQCPLAEGILHLGATSMDIKDNATVMMVKESLSLVERRLAQVLLALVEKIETHAHTPTLAFTHLQPAEPTTLGYRFAVYAQDLWMDYMSLRRLHGELKGKGFTGAVGTSASFMELLGEDRLKAFQSRLAENLGLSFYPVAAQTYPRRQDFWLLNALASIGAGINKFAFDLRFLQTPAVGEWSEPFTEDQVGSSAMPFKKNPIHAEKLNAIARLLAQFPRVAWDNAAFSLLERTLDDSANRRSIIPEAFLMVDELLRVGEKMIRGLEIYEGRISHNMDAYAPFTATEPLLMTLTKKGADRQKMHERLRQHALQAWAEVHNGHPNPLLDLIFQDEDIAGYLSEDEIRAATDISEYQGDAPRRALELAGEIRDGLGEERGG